MSFFVVFILMISNVFQQLVFNTEITFNFDHIFNLDQNSFMAIMASLLLLVALFLFSQRIMDTNLKLGLKKYYRLGALGLASLASIPIISQLNADLPISGLYLANMMHIYPDERSVNNSIRLAAEVCKIIGYSSEIVPYGNSLSAQIGFERS